MLKRFALVVGASVLAVACSQSDAGITTAVKSRFAADDTVKAYQVNVDTSNGVVTLTGEVDSAAAKSQAMMIARGTEGVRDVVDNLHVDETAATTGVLDRMEDRAERGAEAIGEAARDAGSSMKNAAERAGAATKNAAEEVGSATKNAAETAGGVVKDAGITTAVKSKLLADSKVGGLAINVDTKDGVVTLNGDVHSRTEAAEAVRVATSTDGVRRVVDNLTLVTK